MKAIRRATTVLALLLVVAVAAGCGARTSAPPTTARISTATATSTATTTATTTPPSPTVAPVSPAPCKSQPTPAGSVIQAGDILISKPDEPLDDPAVRLPDQTPLKPLQVDTQVSNNALRCTGATAVNPGGLTGSTRTVGFVTSIVNGSASATHVVQSVWVRIDTLTPYSGQLNAWTGCDLAFSRQQPYAHTGGCGGSVLTNEQVKATFPSGAQAGATAVASQVGFDSMPNTPSPGPLPVRITPGMALSFRVYVSVPDMAGTYAFSIGFQVDSAPAAFGPSADAFLAAPVAHTFTGAACDTLAMQAQIPPATTPETFYVCPA